MDEKDFKKRMKERISRKKEKIIKMKKEIGKHWIMCEEELKETIRKKEDN